MVKHSVETFVTNRQRNTYSLVCCKAKVPSLTYFSQFYLYINRSLGLHSFIRWPIPKHLFICPMTAEGAIRLFVHWLIQVQSVYLSIDWSRCNSFICPLTDPDAICLFIHWLIQVQSVYLSVDWSRYNPFICLLTDPGIIRLLYIYMSLSRDYIILVD